MYDWFFGPVATTGWFIAATIFCFCATYIWQIVGEVGGLRGTALALVFTCCAVICSCFGLILSHQTWIPHYVLGAVVTAAWPPILIAALVLTDIYGADRNNHRSFTARSYNAYHRWMTSRKEKRPGHPFALHN